MTIASEITRLQNDKAAMCTAIENKWVTVGNVTFDDYAACIDAIQSWGGCMVDVLVVAWWWSGFGGCGVRYIWWWGWAWQAILWSAFLECKETEVCVWVWWFPQWYDCYTNTWKWWNSSFGNIIALGGWWWGGDTRTGWVYVADDWWSWWWWFWTCYASLDMSGWCWCIWNWITPRWHNGWAWICAAWASVYGGWWWGAWGAADTKNWWAWIVSTIEGELKCYSWWGGWWGCASWSWSYWWWNGACGNWCNATTHWSWWGGGSNNMRWRWGTWCNGVVIVRYKTDWSYWFCNAFWWFKCICWDYAIHCFTQNDKFIICDNATRCIWYLVVGGGGAWCQSGGWWWAVKTWIIPIDTDTFNVVVWTWWATPSANGTESCLWDIVANWWCWWKGWISWGWKSWSWNWWGRWNCDSWWWGWWWWWALTIWCNGSWNCWADGWLGICWYWWGWGAGNYCDTLSCWPDWWWCGVCTNKTCANAKNCWWGWGGARCCCCAWCWWNWVVDVCYACDWSYWFSVATWGDSCYLCWDICVHRFTSNGTFTIVS